MFRMPESVNRHLIKQKKKIYWSTSSNQDYRLDVLFYLFIYLFRFFRVENVALQISIVFS